MSPFDRNVIQIPAGAVEAREREQPLDAIYREDKASPDRWGFREHKLAMDIERDARRPFRFFPRKSSAKPAGSRDPKSKP
jgi:hypothetical protein